jgi:PAS domain S-box-containing protein
LNSIEKLSPRLLQNLVQAVSTGIVITDAKLPDNPIIFANEAFYVMTGYGPEETVGFNCRFLQGTDARQKEVQVLRTAIKAGSHCKVVLRNYKKDGTLFWNELYVSPYFDDYGVLSNFIGIQHDVTAAVEQRFSNDSANVEEVAIRTPGLAHRRILEYFDKHSRAYCAELPKSNSPSTDFKNSIGEVIRALNSHKNDSQLVTPRLAAILASELIQAALLELSAQAAMKEIQIKISQIDGDYHFLADRSMAQLAVKNLVEIAINHSQPGKKVWIVTIANQVATMIAVVDESSELPKAIKEQMLASSVLNKADFKDVSVTGLDLMTAAQIMKIHNGSLELIKSDYSGSEFALVFPRQMSNITDHEQQLTNQKTK